MDDPAALAARPTIATALTGHDNAFGFLRLVLALLVIVDHAFPISGFGRDPMWKWSHDQDSMGGVAVLGFFAISGYLITKSSFATDWLQFLWRRALRILPAYWILLLLTAFVVGPLLWWSSHGHLEGYFAPSPIGPRAYLFDNFFLEVRRYGIHNLLLTSTPYGRLVHHDALNGSIWTLIYEWRCYLLVMALALFGVLRRAPAIVVVLVAGLFVLLILQGVDPKWPARIVPWFADIYVVRFTVIFLMGSLAALYADRIAIDDGLGLFALVVFVGSVLVGGYHVVGYPALAYVMMWLAVRLPRGLRRIGAVNDYSYGTYLYGWLVSQMLAFVGLQRFGFSVFVVVAMLLSLALALASWHLVEKRALRLKSFGPGRGVRALLARARKTLARPPQAREPAPTPAPAPPPEQVRP